MFQSRLSDIVESRGRANTNSRLFSQFKISCQKIEILARVVDLFLIAATARARSWQVRTLLGQRGLSTDGLSLPVTIQEAPLTAFERAVKRTLDVVAAVLLYSSNGDRIQREGVCHLQVPDDDGSRGRTRRHAGIPRRSSRNANW